MGGNLDARILSAVLATAFLLVGCASSGPDLGDNRHRRFKIGQPNYTVAPYQVNGVWYHPKVDYNYDETGTASWYGPGFDGRPTSDGETYDMNGLSAAHKTLPLPSIVQVTNLQNGRALQGRRARGRRVARLHRGATRPAFSPCLSAGVGVALHSHR